MRILSPQSLRQFLQSGVAVVAVTLTFAAEPAFATSHNGDDVSSGSTETSIYTYDLRGDVSDCVGLYPKPNCGTEPLLSGDRGGVMQYATFGVIIAGLGVIMTVIVRNVVRTDRAKAHQAESDLPKPSRPKFNN